MTADTRFGTNNPATVDLCLSVGYGSGRDVLSDVELTIHRGEIVGLIGESGSGKSTLALALFRLLNRKNAHMRGRIVLNGQDLLELKEREMRKKRGSELALVLQSAATALNPALSIGSHLREAWLAHGKYASEWKHAACPLLERVSLPVTNEFFERYPREISVGQAQRLLIAMALIHRPSLLVADEPTSALDPITHAGILELIRELNQDLQLSVLLISHDLLSAASICHRLAILRAGRIVETADPVRIFSAPEHPYTRALIAALPRHPVDSRADSARLVPVS